MLTLSFKALSLHENDPCTNVSLVAANKVAKMPSEMVADEMEKRSTQLAYGLGVGIRQHILGESTTFEANGDLSTYTTWRKRFANWWLGQTPLQEAIERNDGAAIERFVEDTSTLNQLNFHGMAAIHIAVMQDSPNIIQCLHSAQANLSLPNGKGQEPVFLTIAHKKYHALAALIEAGVNFDNKQKVKMEILDAKHVERIKAYLSDLEKVKTETPWIVYEMSISPRQLALILSDVTSFNLIPPAPQVTAIRDCPEFVQSCQDPLFSACYYTNNQTVLETLLNKETNINRVIPVIREGVVVEMTLLMAAAEAKNTKAFSLLLERGADLLFPMKIGSEEVTPLSEIMNVELHAFSEINCIALAYLPSSHSHHFFRITPSITYTPLTMALLAGDVELVSDFLEQGADLFAVNHYHGKEFTPFKLGMRIGGQIQTLFVEALSRMPKGSFNINQLMFDARGERVSPLLEAILHANQEAMVLLLRMGADPFQTVACHVRKRGSKSDFFDKDTSAPLTSPIAALINNPSKLDILLKERLKKPEELTVVGPKLKNVYTSIFEAIIREIASYIKTKNPPDSNQANTSAPPSYYNIDLNGQEYPMHEIANNMDWEQIRFSDEDLSPFFYVIHRADEQDEIKEVERRTDSERYANLNRLDKAIIYAYANNHEFFNTFLKMEISSSVGKMEPRAYALTHWIMIAVLANAMNKISVDVSESPHVVCFRKDVEADLREQYAYFSHLLPTNCPVESMSAENREDVFVFDKIEGRDISPFHNDYKELYVVLPKRLQYVRATLGKPESENSHAVLFAYPKQSVIPSPNDNMPDLMQQYLKREVKC